LISRLTKDSAAVRKLRGPAGVPVPFPDSAVLRAERNPDTAAGCAAAAAATAFGAAAMKRSTADAAGAEGDGAVIVRTSDEVSI
jgi:hypothetical protein